MNDTRKMPGIFKGHVVFVYSHIDSECSQVRKTYRIEFRILITIGRKKLCSIKQHFFRRIYPIFLYFTECIKLFSNAIETANHAFINRFLSIKHITKKHAVFNYIIFTLRHLFYAFSWKWLHEWNESETFIRQIQGFNCARAFKSRLLERSFWQMTMQ